MATSLEKVLKMPPTGRWSLLSKIDRNRDRNELMPINASKRQDEAALCSLVKILDSEVKKMNFSHVSTVVGVVRTCFVDNEKAMQILVRENIDGIVLECVKQLRHRLQANDTQSLNLAQILSALADMFEWDFFGKASFSHFVEEILFILCESDDCLGSLHTEAATALMSMCTSEIGAVQDVMATNKQAGGMMRAIARKFPRSKSFNYQALLLEIIYRLYRHCKRTNVPKHHDTSLPVLDALPMALSSVLQETPPKEFRSRTRKALNAFNVEVGVVRSFESTSCECLCEGKKVAVGKVSWIDVGGVVIEAETEDIIDGETVIGLLKIPFSEVKSITKAARSPILTVEVQPYIRLGDIMDEKRNDPSGTLTHCVMKFRLVDQDVDATLRFMSSRMPAAKEKFTQHKPPSEQENASGASTIKLSTVHHLPESHIETFVSKPTGTRYNLARSKLKKSVRHRPDAPTTINPSAAVANARTKSDKSRGLVKAGESCTRSKSKRTADAKNDKQSRPSKQRKPDISKQKGDADVFIKSEVNTRSRRRAEPISNNAPKANEAIETKRPRTTRTKSRCEATKLVVIKDESSQQGHLTDLQCSRSIASHSFNMSSHETDVEFGSSKLTELKSHSLKARIAALSALMESPSSRHETRLAQLPPKQPKDHSQHQRAFIPKRVSSEISSVDTSPSPTIPEHIAARGREIDSVAEGSFDDDRSMKMATEVKMKMGMNRTVKFQHQSIPKQELAPVTIVEDEDEPSSPNPSGSSHRFDFREQQLDQFRRLSKLTDEILESQRVYRLHIMNMCCDDVFRKANQMVSTKTAELSSLEVFSSLTVGHREASMALQNSNDQAQSFQQTMTKIVEACSEDEVRISKELAALQANIETKASAAWRSKLKKLVGKAKARHSTRLKQAREKIGAIEKSFHTDDLRMMQQMLLRLR